MIPIFLEFFIDNMYLIAAALIINNYVTSMQFIGNLFLAFNRFTIIWFPTSQNKIWGRPWYTILLLTLPFLPVCWRLHEPIIFVFGANGTIAAAFVNPSVAKLSNIVQSCVFIFTTMLAAILNVLSFFKFILHKQNNASFNVKERNLLCKLKF